MATTIEIPASIMAAAAEAGKQQMQALIEKERNVDGYTDNAEELSATNAFFDSLVPEASIQGESIVLSLPDVSNEWGETMETGTNPVAGGQNGMVTHPDGHQEPSRVPPALWGTPLPWLQTAASTWRENVTAQAQTLIPETIREVISGYSGELGEVVKEWASEMLQAALGGAS